MLDEFLVEPEEDESETRLLTSQNSDQFKLYFTNLIKLIKLRFSL